ncbi:hypothetical protein [Nocardia sp. NPDC050710]|uniref:hypothetical protein n=1 Tax=Nocardia sp. NPDC050710 TaxID=3157220 RepID=UPI0033C02DE4
MDHINNPTHVYERAMELQRRMFNATAAANNPDLAYPEWPDNTPLPDLAPQEYDAETAYYQFLDTHRDHLGTHPDFALEYRILADLAAEGRDVSDLFTYTGDPEGRDNRRRDGWSRGR